MTLKAVGVIPKANLILMRCSTLNLKCREKLIMEVLFKTLLWDSGGCTFDSARSNHVVTNCHTELVQTIIALELADLCISDYSCTFDVSYSLLKSDVDD